MPKSDIRFSQATVGPQKEMNFMPFNLWDFSKKKIYLGKPPGGLYRRFLRGMAVGQIEIGVRFARTKKGLPAIGFASNRVCQQ